MIRVILPTPLRTLSRTDDEIQLHVAQPTIGNIIDALELAHPSLRGTLRDEATRQRRPFVRFFACGEDWSHQSLQATLPKPIETGSEPLLIIGAIAGGK